MRLFRGSANPLVSSLCPHRARRNLLQALGHLSNFKAGSTSFQHCIVSSMLGAPLDSQVSVPRFGQTLIPQLEHVRYDPDIDISGMAHDNYSPSYFYMPYSLTQDGINPHGFSGAPVFVNKEPAPDGVWNVSPHMVGIVQRFSRKKGILIVRKIRTVIDLLNEDSGEAQDNASTSTSRTDRQKGSCNQDQ